ncbi:hypothetical protein CFC21_085377 [Triticum aestivum]|uniref:PGG domain-containing protein n=2 Tax=Triticum aestivum TaxID=4565 RepID=A0A3B6NWZ3_WHEAT|nr:uncharacterized protein LOC123131362 [Triticum aestivum]KAF7081437.1 hypothetical protein CFC21_085377 [Triticum aestivum]
MSEQAHSVAIAIEEDMLLGDSSLLEEAERGAMPSGEGVLLGDSSQSQLQEISVNHESMLEEADIVAISIGEEVLHGDSSLPKEADSRAISIGEEVLHGDSSLPKEADSRAIPSGEGILLGDSLQSQQQEINANHENTAEEADTVATPLGLRRRLGGSSLLEEADRVAISIGEKVLLGDSSLPEEANRMAIPSGEGLQLVHSPQPQQQEITIDHSPHMSIDELLKVIKGANGMPVLFVPSSNGRLAAVAVDGLQSLVPANRSNEESAEKKHEAFCSWLMLLMSLVATVTFTAGLTPPGGFWAADDKSNGHVAGMSVMRSKSYRRYLNFYYSNTTAFFTSLMIIGMLARNINNLQSPLT